MVKLIKPITFITKLDNDEKIKPVTYSEVRQDMYAVSNRGRVFSKAYGEYREKSQNIVKEYKVTEMVRPIGDSRAARPIPIHKLVANEFLEPGRPDQTFINHKDGDTLNNDVSNLEYCTPSENNIHAADMGLSRVGEEHHFNKYPESLVHEICNYMQDGYTNADIRGILNVSSKDSVNDLIKDLRRRKTWRSVTKQYSY